MTAEAVTAVISATGAWLVAVAGYLFTKRAERDAAWRSTPSQSELQIRL